MTQPPASDDSALESMSSSGTTSDKTSTSSNYQQHHKADTNEHAYVTGRPKITKPSAKDLKVTSDDLRQAALQMRSNNFTLLSRSIRTVLSCFDDLDISRFEPNSNYLINFISNGIKKCSSTPLRPVSILWPDSYERLVEQLAVLDAHLLNINFREKPVDWMLANNLTSQPTCRNCKEKMSLIFEDQNVRWQCQRSQACTPYLMPIQRPGFFSNYENVSLDKLIFSIYYWSTCTPGEELYSQMNIEPRVLDSLWRRIQNVCRNSVEKRYPRLRLTNNLDQGVDALNSNSKSQAEPIDLVSIKLNDVFIVCAKHPSSNLVRLGLYIPNVSLYSFVDLTETWFAHGAEVRVSETKFLDLTKRRTDLKMTLVSRLDMVSKEGHFDRDSAFGYIICQLSHVLKDMDSSTLSCESLKLILAEIEWRELYGTTPHDSFTNIVSHIAEYGETSDWYSEPAFPVADEETLDKASNQVCQSLNTDEYVWAEKYFYATVDPVDSDGNVICRFVEPPDLENLPPADVRIRCHDCNLRFDSFDLSLHMVAHVEKNRKEHERKEYKTRGLIECKHCFKTYPREEILMHSTLFRSHLHLVKFGCRICCIKLKDRTEYLQHMRRLHFEHETPYRCPTCPFASSFQRDVFIHFQEEHRHSLIILCPLCLRSFTVVKPELMTDSKMSELSKVVYNHIAEHYVTSKGFSCSKCCLCFTDKDKLRAHKRLHHNPLEVRPNNTRLEPFIITPDEEEYCIKALPMELFIANKRPNLTLNPQTSIQIAMGPRLKKRGRPKRKDAGDFRNDGGSDINSEDEVGTGVGSSSNEKAHNEIEPNTSDSSDDNNDASSIGSIDDEDCYFTAREDGTIYVRSFEETKKFLQGGRPALSVISKKQIQNTTTTTTSSNLVSAGCTSQKLIDYLSRMKQADGIVPNQSVILTPRLRPAKCCECSQYITADHFVAKIVCKNCDYKTNCPRAAINHNTTKHTSVP